MLKPGFSHLHHPEAPCSALASLYNPFQPWTINRLCEVGLHIRITWKLGKNMDSWAPPLKRDSVGTGGLGICIYIHGVMLTQETQGPLSLIHPLSWLAPDDPLAPCHSLGFNRVVGEVDGNPVGSVFQAPHTPAALKFLSGPLGSRESRIGGKTLR